MPATRAEEPAPRRRRRAVGPPGATPAEPGAELGLVAAPDPEQRPSADDDERLRRDVPPHHGG